MPSLEQRIKTAKSSAELESVLRAVWGNELVDQVIENSAKHVEQEIDFLQLASTLNPVEYAFAVQNLSGFRKADYLDNLRDYTTLRHSSTETPYEEIGKSIKLEQQVTPRKIESRLHQDYFPPEEVQDPFELARTSEEREQQLRRVWGADLMKVVFEQSFDMACALLERADIRGRYTTEDNAVALKQLCSEMKNRFIITAYRATRKVHQATKLPYDEIATSGARLARISIRKNTEVVEEREIE